MLIASYNPAGMGDVLVVLTAPAAEHTATQKGDVEFFERFTNS